MVARPLSAPLWQRNTGVTPHLNMQTLAVVGDLDISEQALRDRSLVMNESYSKR